MAEKKTVSTIESYSAQLDAEGKKVLEEFRLLMKKIAPNCTEKISYGMPSFDQDGLIVWFAVWKTHYGLYPFAKAIEVFAKDLTKYKTSKGCIQFPAGKPLPKKLITDIVTYRLKENKEKMLQKAAKKKTIKR
jgi:uncharacterized protein YdhG (YjbR/CyaY superfamily)